MDHNDLAFFVNDIKSQLKKMKNTDRTQEKRHATSTPDWDQKVFYHRSVILSVTGVQITVALIFQSKGKNGEDKFCLQIENCDIDPIFHKLSHRIANNM